MPDFDRQTDIVRNGWFAVLFALLSMIIYIAALMCSHIAAFRVQANLRKKMVHHITTLPLGSVEAIGSGKIRQTVNECSAATETYLAHQLPDMARAVVTPIILLIMLFAFDWRFGLFSLIPVVISFIIMMAFMTGQTLKVKMTEYQNALDHISLTIHAGETVAFVGPSGGGKTTLANIICRFSDPQSGSVRIGGVDARQIGKETLRNTVSFVFQNSRMLKASVLDNIRLGNPDATYEEVLTALNKAQCDDIIAKLPDGVETVIGTDGVFLSGGEMQRLALARTILKNAPIVILDEATAFADPDNELKVQKAFEELSKDKTVIMIAHRLSTIANVDKIFVLKEGRIVENGTKTQLMEQHGLFEKMFHDYLTSVSWKVSKEVK